MKKTMKKIGPLGVAIMVLLGLAGCAPPPPSSITLTVEDGMGTFNAAAYQVGNGAWQPLAMSGTTTKTGSFNLPGGQTKYGVAVRCSGLQVTVVQATASELPNPMVVCSSSAPAPVPFTVNVAVDPSLLAPGDGLCVNNMSCVPASPSASISTNLGAGTQDLLLTLVDSQPSVKVAKVLKNVSVTNNGSTSASLVTGDQLSPVSFTLPSPPPGYSPIPFAPVFYLSAGVLKGTVNASPNSYRPVSGFASGDLYAAVVGTSKTVGNKTSSLLSAQAFAAGSPSLVLPAEWTSGSLTVTQGAHPSVNGLSRADPDLRSYRFYLQIVGTIYYTATVSKGWLGNATSYALPDLSASSLLGYTPPSPGNTGDFRVVAFLSNRSWLDFPGPSSAQSGDYIREAEASTNSYTVGGGTVTLP